MKRLSIFTESKASFEFILTLGISFLHVGVVHRLCKCAATTWPCDVLWPFYCWFFSTILVFWFLMPDILTFLVYFKNFDPNKSFERGLGINVLLVLISQCFRTSAVLSKTVPLGRNWQEFSFYIVKISENSFEMLLYISLFPFGNDNCVILPCFLRMSLLSHFRSVMGCLSNFWQTLEKRWDRFHEMRNSDPL